MALSVKQATQQELRIFGDLLPRNLTGWYLTHGDSC
jgi:hypothetical protein